MWRARISGSAAALKADSSRPFTKTSPLVGSIRRLSIRISVDLPLPDSPMMQKISPRRTWIVAFETPTTHLNSCKTSRLPRPRSVTARIASGAFFPNIFQTERQSNRTSSAFVAAMLMFILPEAPFVARAAQTPARPPLFQSVLLDVFPALDQPVVGHDPVLDGLIHRLAIDDRGIDGANLVDRHEDAGKDFTRLRLVR